jgi:ABC-type glutathione transport system ATPase component
MPLVQVNSVSRRTGLHTQLKSVVEDVSLSIETGETLGLVGEPGWGKTTPARMVLGQVKPSRGAVLVDGIDL